MAHYIDKSALVAEIERLSAYLDTLHEQRIIEKILSIIDTLEVKEVDLEKELNDFIEQQKAWVRDNRVVEYNNGDSFNHIYDLRDIAEHFFELGIKAQKEKEV